eukprot:1160701-Pelagomonas_calceolata.AAC.12
MHDQKVPAQEAPLASSLAHNSPCKQHVRHDAQSGFACQEGHPNSPGGAFDPAQEGPLAHSMSK